MAVDTKAKRFSLLNFGHGDIVLPVADGTIDQGDRQHLLGLYSGILAGSGDVAALVPAAQTVYLAGGHAAEVYLAGGCGQVYIAGGQASQVIQR